MPKARKTGFVGKFEPNQRETREQKIHFLRTELQTALTFTQLAHTAKGKDTRQRNVAKARRAYGELIRFGRQAELTSEESQEFEIGMDKLKIALRDLS